MSDTADLRGRGVPTVTLCWDQFEPIARMHARVLGIQSAPLSVYPQRRRDGGTEQDLEHVAVVADELCAVLAPYFEQR
jgi:hypothetical protein